MLLKNVVTDIEGTTTSISFVKNCLFPYFIANLPEFLRGNWQDTALQQLISNLREWSLSTDYPVLPTSASTSQVIESIMKNVEWQMSLDLKTPSLKALQGHVWTFAYEKGLIKGHLFPDVVKFLQESLLPVYIYSSGSVAAQKLLFKYSEFGDLSGYIQGYFDTGIGPKVKSSSYERLAKEIGADPSEILFLSDNPNEIKAALEAGFECVILERPGNDPITLPKDGNGYSFILSSGMRKVAATDTLCNTDLFQSIRMTSGSSNPTAYTQKYADLLSRTSNFAIIESTLREGEQFANAFFDTETKVKIAKALDDFGVEYIELTSPAASEQSRQDCETICKLGLKAKILTHVRCHMDDARLAIETGVDGLDVVIGTSSFLREFSHGKDMDYIINQATEVINFIKSKGLEVRFSSEDSFRSDLVDLLNIYRHVDKLGVNRVGIADTVGCANPRQVYELVRTLRGVVSCDIECHFHNDTGCAIANAYAALEAGATHIDTSVLGIGERNGITPLGGLIARMYTADKDYVKSKYKLDQLRDIENLVAEAVSVQVPFNNYITGYCAFTHKAGIHAKAILNNPSTYEILKPEDFGMTRYVSIGHRLTGWNAVKNRVQQLGLSLNDQEVKQVTAQIKGLADLKPLGIEEVDTLLRNFHHNKLSESELLSPVDQDPELNKPF